MLSQELFAIITADYDNLKVTRIHPCTAVGRKLDLAFLFPKDQKILKMYSHKDLFLLQLRGGCMRMDFDDKKRGIHEYVDGHEQQEILTYA